MVDYAAHLDADRLSPGRLNGIAERLFHEGACSALAIALNDATGWPIVAVTETDNINGGRIGMGSAMHWFVERPDGRLIDVLGAHTREEALEEFPADYEDEETGLAYARREDALEQYEASAAALIPLRTAALFVGAVLERAEESAESS
jgi:hypothetical protein